MSTTPQWEKDLERLKKSTEEWDYGLDTDDWNKVENIIHEALQQERERLKKAFIDEYQGVGEIFFPYESEGNCTKEEEIAYAEQKWDELLKK